MTELTGNGAITPEYTEHVQKLEIQKINIKLSGGKEPKPQKVES